MGDDAYLDPNLPEMVKTMADDIVALRSSLSEYRANTPDMPSDIMDRGTEAVKRGLRWSQTPLPGTDPLAELLHELIG